MSDTAAAKRVRRAKGLLSQRWDMNALVGAPTSRESDKFILRMPDGMRERLAEVAESQGRTMNAVVIGVLAEYLAGAQSLESQLAEIKTALQALTDKVSGPNQAASPGAKERAEQSSSIRQKATKG
jgi:predicted DNA-binding protein